MSAPVAPKVLFVAWSAADWKVVNPLLDAGEMPALDGLIGHGVTGSLGGLAPAIPALLWTSLATGVRADRHGILSPVEPDPITGGVRPTPGPSRRVKALWNILAQNGLHANVVNWPATHPADSLTGVCVSDQFAAAVGPPAAAWPVPPGAVHPGRVADTLADLRVHPADLSGPHLLPFVPRAAEVDQDRDCRLAVLAGALAESATAHAAATWVLEHEPWDFLAIHYDLVDRLGQTFLPLQPPRRGDVSVRDFDLYKDVVAGGYRFLDMMLARLIHLAGPDALMIVASTCALRPTPPGPAVAYMPPGFVCMAGPGVRSDGLLHGAGVLDVTPTILTAFGLPVGADMEGLPLGAAFVDPPDLAHIPTWEAVAGPDGRVAAARPPSADEADEAVKQLEALGYEDVPGEEYRRAGRHQAFTLGHVLLDAGRPADAAVVLEGLVAEQPRDPAYTLFLAQCYRDLGRADDARRLVAGAVPNVPGQAEADTLRGLVALSEGRQADALECFLRAEASAGPRPALSAHIGFTYLRMGRWSDAERAFRQAVAADAANHRACYGVAVACLRQGRPAAAAEAALDAVALRHNFVDAHFALGVALAQMGRPDDAARALRTSVRLRPTLGSAHAWLAALAERAGDRAGAAEHRRRAEELGCGNRAEPDPEPAYVC